MYRKMKDRYITTTGHTLTNDDINDEINKTAFSCLNLMRWNSSRLISFIAMTIKTKASLHELSLEINNKTNNTHANIDICPQ